MRHLINPFTHAEEGRKISAFDDIPLIRLIVEQGATALDALPTGIRNNPEAMPEHRKQPTPGHHRRAADRPQVLRENVRTARYADPGAQGAAPWPTQPTWPALSSSPSRYRIPPTAQAIPRRWIPAPSVRSMTIWGMTSSLPSWWITPSCRQRRMNWRGNKIKEREVLSTNYSQICPGSCRSRPCPGDREKPG